jgi:hypothetical protein
MVESSSYLDVPKQSCPDTDMDTCMYMYTRICIHAIHVSRRIQPRTPKLLTPNTCNLVSDKIRRFTYDSVCCVSKRVSQTLGDVFCNLDVPQYLYLVYLGKLCTPF